MLGFNTFAIFLSTAKEILLFGVIGILTVTVIFSVLSFSAFNRITLSFFLKLLIIYVAVVILSLIAISLPFLYVKKIKISNMIKQYRPTNGIMVFNTVFKIILTIICLVLTTTIFTNSQLLISRYSDSYANWEKTKNYAVNSQTVIKPHTDTTKLYTYNKITNISKELYPTLNKDGGIYAQFGFLNNNSLNSKPEDDYKEITVNPNYLRENSVLDENGNQINISESNSNFIVLIPQKYKSKQADIIEYYEFIKDSCNSSEENSSDDDEISEDSSDKKEVRQPSTVANEKIEIIYTKNNQDLFSYRLDINPNDGFKVEDPIIRVLTESNGDPTDYDIILGIGDSPFKIKVSDPENPDITIRPLLDKYFDSNVYSYPYMSIYKNVADQIEEAKMGIELSIITMTVLLIVIGVIILQNIVNYIEQNKKRIAVEKFQGYKRISIYKDYFYILIAGYLICAAISYFLTKNFYIIVFSLLLMIIDIILSVVLIKVNEKRKIILVTKGA